MLARVVDHDGISLVCGTHPRPLFPIYTAEVVRRARARLRRKRAVPVERLRDAAFGHLIRCWEETIAVVDAQGATSLDLRHRDGDPLVITVDDFEVTPGATAEVEARIAEIEGAEKRPNEVSAAYVILRPDAPTPPDGEQDVLGRVQMAPTALQVETKPTRKRARMRCVNGSRRLRHARPPPGPPAPGSTRAPE